MYAPLQVCAEEGLEWRALLNLKVIEQFWNWILLDRSLRVVLHWGLGPKYFSSGSYF